MGSKEEEILKVLMDTVRRNLRTRTKNWLKSGGRIAKILGREEED